MHFVGRTPIFAVLLGVIALTVNIRGSHAVDFPTRTVRIVIPFSAGGAPDVLFRVVAHHLSEKWKQPVVIENRPGANTNLGTVVVTKAEADGHTLLFTTDGTFIFNPLVYSSMPYAVSELAPVSLVATAAAAELRLGRNRQRSSPFDGSSKVPSEHRPCARSLPRGRSGNARPLGS